MEKEQLKHHVLISYTLKFLSQKDKVSVLRKLQGYQETKNGKLYDHSGLLQEFDGKKLGANVILVPVNSFATFQNFFQEYNIQIELKEVWLK